MILNPSYKCSPQLFNNIRTEKIGEEPGNEAKQACSPVRLVGAHQNMPSRVHNSKTVQLYGFYTRQLARQSAVNMLIRYLT